MKKIDIASDPVVEPWRKDYLERLNSYREIWSFADVYDANMNVWFISLDDGIPDMYVEAWVDSSQMDFDTYYYTQPNNNIIVSFQNGGAYEEYYAYFLDGNEGYTWYIPGKGLYIKGWIQDEYIGYDQWYKITSNGFEYHNFGDFQDISTDELIRCGTDVLPMSYSEAINYLAGY